MFTLRLSFRSYDPSANPDWLIALVFFGPIAIGIAYLIYRGRHNSQWEKGIFPENLKFNRDNLLEAYICLSALLIQKDRRDITEKMQFMHDHFQRHFPESNYNFSDSLKRSYQSPIKPATVAFWLNKNIKDVAKRTQILYFLVGLAMKDEELIASEYRILQELSRTLGLSDKELESIIAMYRVRSRNESEQSVHSGSSSTSKLELYLQVIGLKPGCTIQDI